MPYGGITTFGQSTPQIDSPLQHTGTIVTQHLANAATIYTGSSENGSPNNAIVSSTAIQTSQSAGTSTTSSLFRSDDKRLTREAMEKYLRNRNDMIIVILHAKVITHCYCSIVMCSQSSYSEYLYVNT